MTAELNSPFDRTGADVVQELGASLQGVYDHDSAVRLGARTALPELADLVIIVTQDRSGEERLQVVHVDPGQEPAVEELVRPHLPAIKAAAARDLQQRRGFRWLTQISPVTLRFLTDEPELVTLIYALGIRSLIVVPLRGSGRIFGGMALARLTEAPYNGADLAVTQILARRIATALENVQLHERSVDEGHRRARLEAALQKWAKVFAAAGWGAAIVDGTDYRIEAVNPAFSRLHGYDDPLSLNGKLYSDLLPPERENEPQEWLTAERRPYESAHIRADGTLFPVLTDVTALGVERGARSFVVTIQDLTDLKRTEERLRRAQRLEAVGRLAGGVAHEVNNMMTIILGFSDLLARGAALAPERLRDLEEIRKAAGRAGKTTQQLLAFSRQQILQPTDLNINDVVCELLSALELLLPANIELQTVLSPIGSIVHADRGQLDQVLINLAFNARDAMPEGGTLRLATDSRWLDEEAGRRLIGIPIPPGEYATISVIDTGHGMDQATATHVFEPFFTTKPIGSGTGLGLATVYGTVKQSGGYVWVESTPGEGTTVTVCLPQAAELASDERGEVPPRRDLAACGSGTILVLEDEDGVRDLARRVLEQQGHRVLEARDGPEALEVLEQFGGELDLVLSDVIVPEIGTNELERAVRRKHPNLPILYMSGYSHDEMVGRGLVPTGEAFLQKPFTAEELGELVCRHLVSGETRGEKVNT